jgi:hypothetical protein
VYGDSAPFPLGVDFVATIRALVKCGVSLMNAQHAIDCARARVTEAEEHMHGLSADLRAMTDAVDAALAARGPLKLHVREVANRIGTMARSAAAAEVRHAQVGLDATLVRADRTMGEARKSAAVACGELLAHHDLPGATAGFRLFAKEETYGAEVVIGLPCGLRATFEATLPEGHAWRALRRVRDVAEGVVVTLPREVGWLRKRVEPVMVRLDSLIVLGASLEGSRGALLLGKSERSGIAHAFDLDLSAAAPRVKWRNAEDTTVIDLGAQDAAGIARLLRSIAQSTRDVLGARRVMTEATLEGRPLGECDPADTCARIVGLVAADVREIARRAGAPGELVLRRNVDSGHRDEVFVTAAELLEQIETLPPSLRRVFGPLELTGRPRSPRAPARSLATYEEISACEILPQA